MAASRREKVSIDGLAGLLRSFAFFNKLDDMRLAQVAALAELVQAEAGQVLFREGQPAESLYVLVSGRVELLYGVQLTGDNPCAGNVVAEILPGEPCSISALIEPHILGSTGVVRKPSVLVRIDAAGMYQLFESDRRLAFLLVGEAARAVVRRVVAARQAMS